MVQSKEQTAGEWMGGVDPARARVFRQLRQLCRERLAGWEERMQRGMPGYGPEGVDSVISFNSQTQHIAFYAGPTAIAHFADRRVGIDCGKACVRYR